MTHEPTLKQEKLDIEHRIKTVIIQLERQFVDRAKLTELGLLLVMVTPGNAYRNLGRDRLSFIPDLHRNHPHNETKWAVLLHDLGLALLAYWELIRIDESMFLPTRLAKIEGYAKYGLDQCDLLGDVQTGFYLFNKALQQEG